MKMCINKSDKSYKEYQLTCNFDTLCKNWDTCKENLYDDNGYKNHN